MSKFASKQFWVDTMDRTLSSFAQVAMMRAVLSRMSSSFMSSSFGKRWEVPT